MLLNRHHGFNAPRLAPSIRLVGTYDLAFGGGTTDTVTVPDADLSPASTERQILVITPLEVSSVQSVTVNGVDAGAIAFFSAGGFLDAWFAPYNGDGPFDIVVTTEAASTDDTAIMVFEVDHADLADATVIGNAASSTTVANPSIRVPRDSIVLGVAFAASDTVTLSWSSFSEVVDTDAGTCRIGAATRSIETTSPGTDLVETLTSSGSTTLAILLIVIQPKGTPAVRAMIRGSGIASGSTVAIETEFQLHHQGTVKLVMILEIEADGLSYGASYAGVAFNVMASVTNTGASPDLDLRILELDVDTDATPEGSLELTGTIALGPYSYALYVLKNVRNGDAQTTSGNATGAALAVDVENGGIIIASHIRATDSQTVTWTGVSEVRDSDVGNWRASNGFANALAAEQNRTVQAVGSASGQYATAAVSFNP